MDRVLFVLLIALLNSVQSEKISNLEDVTCTTISSRNVLKNIVDGVEGLFEPSEPLYLEEVLVELPNLKYKLSNSTLAGLSNCQGLRFILTKEDSSYDYGMFCPHLVLRYNYVGKGLLDTVEIDGKGFVTFTLYDYEINLRGLYGEFISENDNIPHFFLKNFIAKFEPKGSLSIDIEGTLHSDKEKSDSAKKHIKEKVSDMEKLIRSPTLESYMAIFVEKIDTYLRTFPEEAILTADN